MDIQSRHFSYLMDFLNGAYGEFAAKHFNSVGANVLPVIVGGASYNIHMLKSAFESLKKIAIPTDDVDLKFFVRDPDRFKQWRALRVKMVNFMRKRWLVFAQTLLHENVITDRRIMLIYHGETHDITEDHRVERDGKLKREFKVWLENKNQQPFDAPVDLMCIIVKYLVNGQTVQTGLMDLSIVSPKYAAYVYNMYAEYHLLQSPELVIDRSRIDSNVQMFRLKGMTTYSSYEYIMMDTARMLAKVEFVIQKRFNEVSIADVYKYIKYLRKFYQLAAIHMSVKKLHKLSSIINQLQVAKIVDAHDPRYATELTELHTAIKDADVRLKLNVLSKWLNERTLPALTMSHHMAGGADQVQVMVQVLSPTTRVVEKMVVNVQTSPLYADDPEWSSKQITAALVRAEIDELIKDFRVYRTMPDRDCECAE